MANPILYTSRTFNTILADINSDNELVDKPNWWKRLWAGVGDVISMWENASANNMFLRTAFTRRAVSYLLELIDYQLTPQSTSSGYLHFYLKSSTVFPITVAVANLAALSQSTLTVGSKRFEGNAAATVNAVTESVAYTAVAFATGIWTVARVYTTGEKVRLTGSDLPAPLTTSTDYYVIKIGATQIKLAASLADAYNSSAVALSDSGTGTHTLNLYSFIALCYQQETKASQIIGSSDGSTAFQEFTLPDLLILQASLLITINSVTWTRADSLASSTSTDTHFKCINNSDGTITIQFGNGTYGAIPGAFPVYAAYAVGGGNDSNITAINKVITYSGNDSNIDAVSNYATFTGGADAENIESAKIIAPLLLKARDRFVTTDDGLALTLAYTGVGNATVIRNFYGTLSAKVCCIANGGGNLSTGDKNTLQAYLIDKTILEAADIRVVDSTISAYAVTSAAKMKTGYSWTNVQPYFRLAWKLFLSEAGREIYFDYISNGIASAIVKINAIFTEAFTSADYTQIIALLDDFDYIDYGESRYDSDAFAYVAGRVFGIDYMTIAAPAFPITLATDAVTTFGSLTLTQILGDKMLPIPFEKFIPSAFKRDSKLTALADKIDTNLTLWKKEILDYEMIIDPARIKQEWIDEVGELLNAGIFNYDTDQQKRIKLLNAIQSHKNRGSFTNDAKSKIDAIAGGNSSIVSGMLTDEWIICGDGTEPTAAYWATLGCDGVDLDLGIALLGTGLEAEVAGNIYIDVDNPGLTAAEIAQIKAELERDIAPAYMWIHVGYISGGAFIEYTYF